MHAMPPLARGRIHTPAGLRPHVDLRALLSVLAAHGAGVGVSERALAEVGAAPLAGVEVRVEAVERSRPLVVGGPDGRPHLASVPARAAVEAVEAGCEPCFIGIDDAGVGHLVIVGDPLPPSLITSAPMAEDGAAAGTVELRGIAERFDECEIPVVMAAVALAQWHCRAGFCASCGSRTCSVEAGWARRCVACGHVEYPRQDPAVIVAVTDEDDRLLLAHNRAWEPGRVSVLAGFVEAGEAPSRTVEREVCEEVGLEVCDIEVVTAQPWPFPRSLMLAFRARLRAGTPARPVPDGEEIEWARFFTREELVAEVEAGRVSLPGPAAIAHVLVSGWFGTELPGRR